MNNLNNTTKIDFNDASALGVLHPHIGNFINNHNDIDSLKKAKKIFRKMKEADKNRVLSLIMNNNKAQPKLLNKILCVFLSGSYKYEQDSFDAIVKGAQKYINSKKDDVGEKDLYKYCFEKMRENLHIKNNPRGMEYFLSSLNKGLINQDFFLKIINDEHLSLPEYIGDKKVCVLMFNDFCYALSAEEIESVGKTKYGKKMLEELRNIQKINVNINGTGGQYEMLEELLRKSHENQLNKIKCCEVFLPFVLGEQNPNNIEYRECVSKYKRYLSTICKHVPKQIPINMKSYGYGNFISASLLSCVTDDNRRDIDDLEMSDLARHLRGPLGCPGNKFIVDKLRDVKNSKKINKIRITEPNSDWLSIDRMLCPKSKARHLFKMICELNKYNVSLIKTNGLRVRNDDIGNLKSEQKIKKANKNNKKAQKDGKGNKKKINDNLKKKQRRNILKDKAKKKTVLPEYYKGDDASVITNANSDVLNLNDKNRDIINSQDILPYI